MSASRCAQSATARRRVMNRPRTAAYLPELVDELRKLSAETAWVEFKHNRADPQAIGEYLSALSNSAALNDKPAGYVVWGIDDETHNVVGTTFTPSSTLKGAEPLENWLVRLLNPTNSSLRERFRIESQNSAIASRIIGDAIAEGWIKPHDPNQGKKYAKYVPFWA